ncbi:MAG: hypothetical protein ACR2KS_10940 [Candidatus Eremiobacter antarcticus]
MKLLFGFAIIAVSLTVVVPVLLRHRSALRLTGTLLAIHEAATC